MVYIDNKYINSVSLVPRNKPDVSVVVNCPHVIVCIRRGFQILLACLAPCAVGNREILENAGRCRVTQFNHNIYNQLKSNVLLFSFTAPPFPTPQ